MLKAAMKYASRGLTIFPCAPAGKHPIVKGGLLVASADMAKVSAWWMANPDANIGLPTGSANRLIVVDIDGDAGRETFARIEAKYGAIATACVLTSNGRHLYFRYAGTDIRNSAKTRLGAGIDVRGEGGYVVAPPSLHPSGRRYEWLRPQLPAIDAPEWLLTLLRLPPKPPALVQSNLDPRRMLVRRARLYIAAAEGAPEGCRNAAAFKLAGNVAALVDGNGEVLAESEILSLMEEFNRRCLPPMANKELAATVHSAMTNGTAREPKPPVKEALCRVG